MTVRHRRWHFWSWAILTPTIIVAVVLAWKGAGQ